MDWIGKKAVATTEFRGVFHGTIVEWDADARRAVIADCCRNCVYWSSSVKGFVGLAKFGPDTSCRVGPATDRMQVEAVTSLSVVTDGASAKWEAEPWS